MSNQKLKNQIIAWLKGQPYWMGYLGNAILEGADLTDDLLSTAYRYFKEDEGLAEPSGSRDPVDFNPTVAEDLDPDHTLRLRAIKNIANVNALAAGQEIRIGPNLTVVYGSNGSGKSGYIRLLNNVFPSRGQTEILPNVFAGAGGGPPGCQFTFARTEEPYDLHYPADGGSPEFARFSVFDTASIDAHLGKENQLAFTPGGFEFFEDLVTAHAAIHEKLKSEIAARSVMHDLGPMFTNENEVQAFISALGPDTPAGDLEALCALGADSEDVIEGKRARLEALKAADRSKQIEALVSSRAKLEGFCEAVTKALESFSAEALTACGEAIDEMAALEELATSEGLQGLEKYPIERISSPRWREFVRAGRAYASAIEGSRAGPDYPADGDKCLFCLRPLEDEQRALIRAYWALLESQAETELARARADLAARRKRFAELPALVFDETATAFEIVNRVDPETAERWKGVIAQYNEARESAIAAIGEKDRSKLPEPIAAPVSAFDRCKKVLDDEKAALIDSDPKQERAQLEAALALHEDRVLLAKVRPRVEAYLDGIKWAAKAGKKSATAMNGKITRIQGQLYAEHVSEEYVAAFNQECKHLKAPTFVGLSQRNTRGSTLRKLHVQDHHAKKILSEGEQRAVSIADFITEARLNPVNRGVIFDDPVSSQDHERRELIAARLVEIAKMKQVVVFTHDIVFLIRLTSIAELEHVGCEVTTVRSTGQGPGIVKPELPMPAQSVRKRIGWLRDALVRLGTLEKNGDEDAYFAQATLWYKFLREGWERAVEECLFKDVIQRYNPAVQTKRLENVRVTQDLIDDVKKAMSESSTWVHDPGGAANPTPPDTEQAGRDLENLCGFVEKCKSTT